MEGPPGGRSPAPSPDWYSSHMVSQEDLHQWCIVFSILWGRRVASLVAIAPQSSRRRERRAHSFFSSAGDFVTSLLLLLVNFDITLQN